MWEAQELEGTQRGQGVQRGCPQASRAPHWDNDTKIAERGWRPPARPWAPLLPLGPASAPTEACDLCAWSFLSPPLHLLTHSDTAAPPGPSLSHMSSPVLWARRAWHRRLHMHSTALSHRVPWALQCRSRRWRAWRSSAQWRPSGRLCLLSRVLPKQVRNYCCGSQSLWGELQAGIFPRVPKVMANRRDERRLPLQGMRAMT